MDLIHLNLLVIMLIWRFYIKDIILLESVSKAWHTCKARLMGVRRLSHVKLMFWVRGVTIKIVIPQKSDKCMCAESHIGHILDRTGLY